MKKQSLMFYGTKYIADLSKIKPTQLVPYMWDVQDFIGRLEAILPEKPRYEIKNYCDTPVLIVGFRRGLMYGYTFAIDFETIKKIEDKRSFAHTVAEDLLRSTGLLKTDGEKAKEKHDIEA